MNTTKKQPILSYPLTSLKYKNVVRVFANNENILSATQNFNNDSSFCTHWYEVEIKEFGIGKRILILNAQVDGIDDQFLEEHLCSLALQFCKNVEYDCSLVGEYK